MPDFSRWLIVSDFDRTLTDRQSRIPAANLEAIRYFTAHGGLFTMGTGRSVPMFRPYQAGIPCNAPLILFNGAALYDYGTDELTETVWIPEGRALLRALLDRYPELWFEIQHRDAHYLIGENPRRDRFYRDLGVEYRVVGPEEVPVPFLKLAIFSEFRDLGVSQFFGGTPAERARFDEAERQINRDWPELVADRSAPLILDVQHRRATKGAAARRLAERLGRTLVCVGDAMNDASMLREADLAFAPADCDPAVKALGCCTLTRPCGEGAIAGVVEALAGEKLRIEN